MIFGKKRIGLAALVAALMLVLILPGIASAHERRMVGKYQMVVGFSTEPAFAGDKNGLDLTICQGECKYDGTGAARVLTNPVKDADKTLKAEVISAGAAPLPLEVKARFGADGKYDGFFYPTKAGDYTFRIFGTIGSDKIDEKFSSSPTTFGSVEDVAALQYPTKLSVSPGSNPETIALQQQAKEAKDAAGTATIFGIIGMVVGLLGLGAAAFAISRSRMAVASPASDASREAAMSSNNRRGPDAG